LTCIVSVLARADYCSIAAAAAAAFARLIVNLRTSMYAARPDNSADLITATGAYTTLAWTGGIVLFQANV